MLEHCRWNFPSSITFLKFRLGAFEPQAIEEELLLRLLLQLKYRPLSIGDANFEIVESKSGSRRVVGPLGRSSMDENADTKHEHATDDIGQRER